MIDVFKYLTSDSTVDQLSRLLGKVSEYKFLGIDTLDGEARIGAEGYIEYHLDENLARAKTVEIFYEEK